MNGEGVDDLILKYEFLFVSSNNKGAFFLESFSYVILLIIIAGGVNL